MWKKEKEKKKYVFPNNLGVKGLMMTGHMAHPPFFPIGWLMGEPVGERLLSIIHAYLIPSIQMRVQS
jgi:hypothetical protein